MDITINPGKLSGNVAVIPSKSQAHRFLICAAFAATETSLICPDTNRDIAATADCLRALGADIQRTCDGYRITPTKNIPEKAVLDCCESGSTLRFMLPIAGALGVDATFKLAGRLPQRPLSPLWEEMERMGCSLTRPSENTIRCFGKLQSGDYTIDGGVSSQFITGLLFALPFIHGQTRLNITGKLESKPYITMTENAIQVFNYPGKPSPGSIAVEGDWSNGAFWLSAAFLGSDVFVSNLNENSPQGDKAIKDILPMLGSLTPTISAADIPDLVPILAVAAAANNGAVFTDIGRLRLKESDRVASVVAMLTALGGNAEATENTLTVHAAKLTGGTVDACNDHRIAMAAAIASTVCTSPVTVLGAECVSKSYPAFWEEFTRLGGNYEQYLR